jgi:hypothetical protein
MALINIALLRGVHLLRFVECYEVCSCLRLSVSLKQHLPGKYCTAGLRSSSPLLKYFKVFINIAFLKHTAMLWL